MRVVFYKLKLRDLGMLYRSYKSSFNTKASIILVARLANGAPLRDRRKVHYTNNKPEILLIYYDIRLGALNDIFLFVFC